MRERRATLKDWLPLTKAGQAAWGVPTGEAFRTEWIDFSRGIRVGNLEPRERITRILKYRLEEEYGTPFVTDRWGRGVYWQWICWLPRANRLAKPVSSGFNFGCAKFFIMADRADRVLLCGLQVERGFAAGDPDYPRCLLAEDWDWHRLMKQCAAGTETDREMQRLIRREGFVANLHGGDGEVTFDAKSFTSARQIRQQARKCPADRWAGFQLAYPIPADEVGSCAGYELVQAILGAFLEVSGVMNRCMQVRLEPVRSRPRFPAGEG